MTEFKSFGEIRLAIDMAKEDYERLNETLLNQIVDLIEGKYEPRVERMGTELEKEIRNKFGVETRTELRI